MKETLRATWVIARRDFTALVASRAFLIFLFVPLMFAGVLAGATLLEGDAPRGNDNPTIGMQLSQADAARLIAKRAELQRLSDIGLPLLTNAYCPCSAADGRYRAILSGSIAHPILTTSPENADRWQGRIALIIHAARQRDIAAGAPLLIRTAAGPPITPDGQGRTVTAQAGQAAIFLLTLLLAGMVISNLVEEKTSKIIEILAASISVDAIFLGKLLAMLGIALVAIMVWGFAGAAVQILFGLPLPDLAPPATGWPIFLTLAIAYFFMVFLLFGTLLLGIGSLANTVREVQTLSLPITLGQLLIFFLASYAVNAIGRPIEIVAAIFPFSSPFAMVSRAAQQASLLPHALALPWQALWVWVTIRAGSALFRRNVLKSGKSRRSRRSLP